jgi:hypothetical protein
MITAQGRFNDAVTTCHSYSLSCLPRGQYRGAILRTTHLPYSPANCWVMDRPQNLTRRTPTTWEHRRA